MHPAITWSMYVHTQTLTQDQRSFSHLSGSGGFSSIPHQAGIWTVLAGVPHAAALPAIMAHFTSGDGLLHHTVYYN